MDLFTTIYPIRSSERLREIRTCMEKNLVNLFIDHIWVFVENMAGLPDEYKFLLHPKIQLVHVKERPTYRQFFSFAKFSLPSHLVAVANSDVYFDRTVMHAASIKENQLWCLCRYNEDEYGDLELQHGGMQGSADAWIFRAPLKDFEDDIKIGVLGCDSYLAQKAAKAGIELKNPCLKVILRHLHKSTERNDAPDGMKYWDAPDYAYHVIPPSY